MTSSYLTISEAAEYVRASARTIRRAIRSGELQHVGSGHLIRIRPEWLEDWLEQRAASHAGV